jgi:hypothetical protein
LFTDGKVIIFLLNTNVCKLINFLYFSGRYGIYGKQRAGGDPNKKAGGL